MFSIIVVTYNAAASLEATICSVIHQTYTDIELIIVDGASTDGTVDLFNKYNKKISYWVSEPDKGVYDAMNKGTAKAKGKWIYFLGSGDLLLNVLDKVAPMLADNKTIYYGDVYRKDLLAIYGGKFSGFRFAVSNICHQSIFYPAEIFKKRQYDTKYKIQADYAFNMVHFGDKKYKFQYLPVIISLYEGDGYSDKTPDYLFFEDKIKLIRANFPLPVYLYAWMRRKMVRMLTSKYKKKNSNQVIKG